MGRTAMILMMILLTAATVAAGRVTRVEYAVPPVLSIDGGRLTLSFTAGVPEGLGSRGSVTLRPVYVSGADTVRFPELLFCRASEARYRRRRATFSRGPATETLEAVCGKEVREVEYSESRLVPCDADGTLLVRQTFRDCCHTLVLATDTVRLSEDTFADPHMEEDLVAADILDGMTAAASSRRTGKPATRPLTRRESVTVHIDYPVDRSNVLPDFRDNRMELARLDSVLRPVSENPNLSITGVTVDGYASPEDTWRHNLDLSRKRAEGMRDYVARTYGIPSGVMTAIGHGEDWEGLSQAVEESGMEHSDEILGVIRRYDVWHGREKRLMDLRGGEPYREMIRDIFPKLRRITVTIRYTVRGKEENGGENSGENGKEEEAE